MKMAAGVRIKFMIYLTSKEADNSCSVSTPTFKHTTTKELKAYLKTYTGHWQELLNNEFGVNDFRLMTDEETTQYVTLRHKHLIGEDHEDVGIRH